MLSLNNIKSTAGSKKSSKRLGRWNGSGLGTYSGRGCKGQNARSGGGVPQWFEWGQTPLFRRMPKLKGFSNAKFQAHYNIVNISDVAKLAENGVTEITKESLMEHGVVTRKYLPVKLLGKGEISKKVTVKVAKASKSAQEAVEKAGGTIELV